MRPAPPRGAVFEQFWFKCDEFQDDNAPDESPPGPRPSECPTCPTAVVAADVQSPHVDPAITVPSALEPAKMSCSTGEGEPVNWPLIWVPRSSTKIVASPRRVCSSFTFAAICTPFELNHGPLPMRLRASVIRLPLSGSRSTLK